MISPETFERLLAPVACGLSIYMPIDPSQRDQRAPQARLRMLADMARTLLERRGASPEEQDKLLNSLNSFTDAADFAQHRDPGLAVFVGVRADASDLLEVVPMPYPPPELVLAGPDFHIKPMLPLMAMNQRFNILALSKGNVKLLTATPFAWSEVPLEALPVEAQAELDSRAEAGSMGDTDAMQDERKKLLVANSKYIATAVKAAIGVDTAPIILSHTMQRTALRTPIYPQVFGKPFAPPSASFSPLNRS